MNQVLFHSPCPNQSHTFVVLSSFLNAFSDYDAYTICPQLQEGGLSYISHKELGSIVQSIHKIVKIYFSSFIAKWESNASISSDDYFSVLGDFHSSYHFPISTSNDICFTPLDLHFSTYLSSYLCQAGEALHPSLIVMAGPHCLGMTAEYDQIYFPSEDSNHDPISLIKISRFSIFLGFQEGHHEFYYPNTKWMEQYYFGIYVANNKLQYFLMLSKDRAVDEDISIIGF